jgi:hypothetical protein
MILFNNPLASLPSQLVRDGIFDMGQKDSKCILTNHKPIEAMLIPFLIHLDLPPPSKVSSRSRSKTSIICVSASAEIPSQCQLFPDKFTVMTRWGNTVGAHIGA